MMAEAEMEMHPEKQPVVPRSDIEKQQLTNRLKRIEGQVRGLQKMIEEDRYCVDVLVQLSAVNAALKKVGYSLLERHTKTCVAEAVRSGDANEQIQELMSVVQQFAK